MLKKFEAENGPIWLNPSDIVQVYEADKYRHRGPWIGLKRRGGGEDVLVYGSSVDAVAQEMNTDETYREIVEDRDSLQECVDRIGKLVGCGHTTDRDGRTTLVRCVREALEGK